MADNILSFFNWKSTTFKLELWIRLIYLIPLALKTFEMFRNTTYIFLDKGFYDRKLYG